MFLWDLHSALFYITAMFAALVEIPTVVDQTRLTIPPERGTSPKLNYLFFGTLLLFC